ncbi:hypothetical protein C8J57DRAFT_1377051 [Mycena rebaudengoi]|nr:hypothetical protein C8J57DRAFT_1377051 [Mycena rebaudengoi]
MRPPYMALAIVLLFPAQAQSQSTISADNFRSLSSSASSQRSSLSTYSSARTSAAAPSKTSHSTSNSASLSIIVVDATIDVADEVVANEASITEIIEASEIVGAPTGTPDPLSSVVFTLIIAYVSYRCFCRPSSRHRFRSFSNSSIPAKPALDLEHGRALEEEVAGLRQQVARLEAERIAAGPPPSFDAAPPQRDADVYVGEKDDAAMRAYTAGLATMGGLKGDMIHSRRETMRPPPPKYEG